MGEAQYENDGTGNVLRIGNTFESRSAAMVLNYPERLRPRELEGYDTFLANVSCAPPKCFFLQKVHSG